YAATSAPVAAPVYPPGSIPPPPAALGQIPQAISNSTRDGGALSTLWQPLAMTKDAPQLPKPSERAAEETRAAHAPRTASPTNGSQQPWAEIGDSPAVGLATQPFQMTNGSPATTINSSNSSQRSVAANENAPTIGEAIAGSALFRQLSM